MGCAQLTWLLDDVGIPQDWRHLEGNSVNTYLFINAQGKERYFKMRWLPEGGARLPFSERVAQNAAWLLENTVKETHDMHSFYCIACAMHKVATLGCGCQNLVREMENLVRCWLGGGAVDLVVNLRADMLAGAYRHLRNNGSIAWYQCMLDTA